MWLCLWWPRHNTVQSSSWHELWHATRLSSLADQRITSAWVKFILASDRIEGSGRLRECAIAYASLDQLREWPRIIDFLVAIPSHWDANASP
jgi:hypothetical protein